MVLFVCAVELHLIRTDGFWSIRVMSPGPSEVCRRHTFPRLLFVLWKHLSEPVHILKLTDRPVLFFYENVLCFKAIVYPRATPIYCILRLTCDTRMYVVKFKKPFIVSGLVLRETDPDFLQMHLFCVLLRSSFFHTLSVSGFYFYLADHVADRWGEECSMWHEVGRLFA